MRAVVQPVFMATAVGTLLYACNPLIDILPAEAASILPFWVGVVRPSGIFWNKVNKKIAAATGMPAEMQRFKELFLVSNKAIAADFISNQVVYHFGVALLLYAYTYSIRKYAVDKPPSLTGWGLLMKIGPDLLRTRLLMTVISIGSEYWMSYFSIQSIKGKLSIPEGSKRLILLKEFILSVAWYTFCLNKYYTNF